ncbi:aminotransferase class III-fold pyridoxal phosphate-dependent enzyme [Streptomyces sp. NPDC046324]|uniref:aspartate aminotransferase family protein n=1 Tax=Streptomyces sp. NPDC046324 TaxID=3154915 RepID=UPI00340C4B3C
MSAGENDLELAEPHLRQVLASVGLDIGYEAAEGDILHCRDENGRLIPVLDLVGGFGSLILGHNHPEINAYAKELLDLRTPVHAQFSRHPHANELAAELTKVIRREFGIDEPYYAIFANSGAEAIEIAIKHAELDRSALLAELSADITAHIDTARDLILAGQAVLSLDAYSAAGVPQIAGAGADVAFEQLAAAIDRRNAELLSKPPLFLAPEGSFHGKLVGSVQLTHNPAVRTPFMSLAAQARFVPLDDPSAIRKTVEQEQTTPLLDLTLDDGVVGVTERPLPVFAAFVLEPIQGEGGIRPVSREFAEEIRRVADELGCPVVVDEIQSGMGRTGAFFAGSHIGLHGDYVTLAKSLGGGLAKISVTLIRASRYRQEFEIVHSSTFAKDGFSTLVALKTLSLLEAGEGRAYRTAEERGIRLTSMLQAIKADYPDVIKDVRGRGLMLGVEFHDQSASASEPLQATARAGFFGFTLAGYLLRAHQVRAFPTASAVNTLRLEPSIGLTDAQIDQVETAFRAACALLRDQDGHGLTSG